jgi:hypothetical protein
LIAPTRPLLATCLALFACVPASAQAPLQPTRPERPYRGVFASGVDASGQSLTASSTLSGGYDDNVLADATRRSTFRNGQGGSLGQFSGGLNYALVGERGTANAAVGTSVRYYPSLRSDLYKTYNGSVGGTLQLSKKPNLSVHQSASYKPYTFLPPAETGATAGVSSAPELDFVPLATQYIGYEGGADLRHPLSKRLSFQSSYGYVVTDRLSKEFWRQTGATSFSIGMTRDVSLRLGYRYTEAHYDTQTVATHRPDVGLDFLHALSLTRRTNLTFGVGTEATVIRGVSRWHVTGNAQLTHEMGRTWSTVAAYERGTYFSETLSTPIFGNSASATLGGLITRRLQFQMGANALVGKMGFSNNRNMNLYRGSVTLSTALTRFMNVGIDYAYYKYNFDDQIELDPRLPTDINRQSIRAHVSLWAPIINRSRTANASR